MADVRTGLRWAVLAAGAAGVAGAAAQVRVARAARPLTGRWEQVPVAPRGGARLGISFRPLQACALGLEPMAALTELLRYDFELIRLGAYWDRIETGPGRFDPSELDRQVDAAERAGKQIILCVGPVKTFGYPEFFVPSHQLPEPLREGILVEPGAYGALVEASTAFASRLVTRYRDREAIVAWQVEHDAVDPLGMEHSWRLSAAFVRREVEAVRAADPTRPVLMNGFLPTSAPVRLQQWWRTRDQGDSLVVAQQLADIVGVDFYPRHAVVAAAGRTVYLAGRIGALDRRRALLRAAAAGTRRLMIIEGQAEPWEAVTTPPSPQRQGMYSCLPEHVIENYSQCMRWNRRPGRDLEAYLFWGAEYWLLRQQQGDPRYLRAFARILRDA
jgi:Beta-galactosidase